MRPDHHSFTAVMMAAIRAAHFSQPQPRIFEDALAVALLSAEELKAFENTSARLVRLLRPEAASPKPDAATVPDALRLGPGVSVLARAGFIEESLFACLRDGVRQYVIVGAGLDTFALRHPELSERLSVIEIDHPATQAFKRARMAQAGLSVPRNLHFVAADFERESLADALRGTAYDPSVPAFFACSGVAYYLSSEAVLATLRSIASVAASGSQVLFDYFEAGAFAPDAPLRIRFVVERSREVGEPLKSSLDPAKLRADLAAVGLQLTEDLGPEEIQRRLLANLGDFQAVPYWHFVQATRKAADV